jgi:prepilin peptidase CpaA
MPGAMIAASYAVLAATAALLAYMAFHDLREFKIRNELVLVLAGIFFLHAALSGRWVVLHWNLAFAAGMGVLLLIGYAFRLLGGGDVKLLTVAFLWTGFRCAVPFLLVVTAVSMLMIVAAHFGWIAAKRVNKRLRVPFAPAIAIGLIAIFLMGCLAPINRSGVLWRLSALTTALERGHSHPAGVCPASAWPSPLGQHC